MFPEQVELQNWKDMEVHEEIEDQGQKAISTRLMIKGKICEGQKGAKACLVARRFEDEDQVPSVYREIHYNIGQQKNGS